MYKCVYICIYSTKILNYNNCLSFTSLRISNSELVNFGNFSQIIFHLIQWANLFYCLDCGGRLF